MLKPHERYERKLFAGSSHSWAIDVIQRYISDMSKSSATASLQVLDVGSGSGVMGETLKAMGIPQLHAVEIDPDAKKHAESIYKQVETSLDAYTGNSFHLILLMDVLEHCLNPKDMLNKALSLLDKDGCLLLSVPNIAHWSIRLMLLCGHFDYTERGILDKTHLVFFTKRRLIKLVAEFPCAQILEYQASISPLELVTPTALSHTILFRSFSWLRSVGAKVWPELFGYQHMMVVKKN